MKKFNNLREEALLEKLKASDPTGKWISDFVHSDNPKFSGKSKKERIRMALGASYAAKRNEEVEQTDEGMMDTVKSGVKKVVKAVTGGSDEDQLKRLQKNMGLPQTGKKPQVKEEADICPVCESDPCICETGQHIEEESLDEAKPGLYANIHAKRKRIAAGSGERMRKPGSKGAPTAQSFRDAAKTARK